MPTNALKSLLEALEELHGCDGQLVVTAALILLIVLVLGLFDRVQRFRFDLYLIHASLGDADWFILGLSHRVLGQEL